MNDKFAITADMVNSNMNVMSTVSPSQKDSPVSDSVPIFDDGVIGEEEGTTTSEPLQSPAKASIQGNLQALLQKHGADNLPPIEAVSASSASIAGARSRSNTLLSDFGFSSGVRSRSNTMGSDLDLDFVHYACDAWGLIVSNTQQQHLNQLQTTTTSVQYQHSQLIFSGKDLGTATSTHGPANTVAAATTTNSIAASFPPRSSTVGPSDTTAQTLTSKPSAPIAVAASTTSIPAKHPGSAYIVHTGGRRSCSPALSLSFEDSVSGFFGSTGLLSHTPPLNGTSYEASHFGKRMRSGSISGRLRSASDLEDRGIIDRSQRNLLKDLIISNAQDAELQAVLDHYETTGDTSGLEQLISEGRLLQRHHADTLDLLDDLDLDFLNVGGDDVAGGGVDFEGLVDAGTPGLGIVASQGFGTKHPSKESAFPDDGVGDLEFNDDLGESDADTRAPATRSSSRAAAQAALSSRTSRRRRSVPARVTAAAGFHVDGFVLSPDISASKGAMIRGFIGSPRSSKDGTTSGPDDVIGDMDFDGDIGDDDNVRAPSTTYPLILSAEVPAAHGMSLDELQRRRADSIQIFSSLFGSSASDDFAQATFGKWADDMNIEEVEKDEWEFEETTEMSEADTGKPRRGRRKSEATLMKEREAEDRRRERIQRREEKEREKQERKDQKERERREREEKEEIMKEEKRLAKELAALAKLEKKMEIEQKKAEKLKEKIEKEKEKEEKKVKKEQEKKEGDSPPAKTKPKEKDKEKQKEKDKKEEPMEEDEPLRKETPSGLGRPRSMSDPNVTYRTDEFGLLSVDAPEGWVGAYSPDSRKMRIDRFLAKRNHRVWTKTVKYDVRKNFADSRLRVKGRFVKKEDEQLMRDLMSLT